MLPPPPDGFWNPLSRRGSTHTSPLRHRLSGDTNLALLATLVSAERRLPGADVAGTRSFLLLRPPRRVRSRLRRSARRGRAGSALRLTIAFAQSRACHDVPAPTALSMRTTRGAGSGEVPRMALLRVPAASGVPRAEAARGHRRSDAHEHGLLGEAIGSVSGLVDRAVEGHPERVD